MSLGNIDSKIRNRPSMNAWIPIALLPIPHKRLEKLPDYSLEQQELDALQILHKVVSHVLSPLSDPTNLQGVPMVCCDEKVRKCVPKLAAWLADYIENCTLHGIATNRCPICTSPPDALGELPKKPFAPRQHDKYAADYKRSDVSRLHQAGVKNINNALWHYTNFKPQEIVKPDILHTLYRGMLVHLMKWIMKFLTLIGRANTFDHLWSHLPPYPGFTRPNKPYRSVSKWQGKEMRNLLRVILGVFTAALSRTSDLQPLSPQHNALAQQAILCVRYLSDFIILAQYRVHTENSIQSMVGYLKDFDKHKEVFLRVCANKSLKSSVREATRDPRSQHRSATATSDAPTSSKRQKLTNEFQLETEELESDLLRKCAYFNFPKMHLISHFPDTISKYGSLSQYSTGICEASHRSLKFAYYDSNHINVLPEILDSYTRKHSFVMRDLNIAQWSKEIPAFSPDIIKVLRPTPRRLHVPPGSPASCLYPKLQGRVGLKQVYNLLTLANYFSLPDLQPLTNDYMVNNIFKSSSDPTANATRLKGSRLEAFNTLQVPVLTCDDNGRIFHVLRSTEPKLLRNQGQRHEWVFVRRRPSSLDKDKIRGSLDGRVPARLNALFKMRDPDTNTAYRLAHVSLLKVIGSHTPDGPEGMVRVGIPLRNHVIKISDIEGMAHLIPIEPDKLYLVNNRIDLE